MTTVEYQLRAHEFVEIMQYGNPVIVEESSHHKHFKTVNVKNKCDWVYPALGLSEEAGEVCGKFAKIIRDKDGELTDFDKQEISKELGDCLWMIAEICTILGLKLHEVMEQNIIKLESRKQRNVLSGSGDNRQSMNEHEHKKLIRLYNRAIKKRDSYLKRKNKTLAAFWYSVAVGAQLRLERLEHFEQEKNLSQKEREIFRKELNK